MGVYTNTNYRVRTTDRRAYLLRVCTPGWRTLADLQSEGMWLQALHRDRTAFGDRLADDSFQDTPTAC